MEWLPPWLARAYAKIYVEKKTEQFEFAEAASILAIQEERRLAKTLTGLKASGHLTVKRDPVDARRKLFNLIDPVSTTLAYAIQSRARSPELIEKLRSATGALRYYLSGPYAAYQYHHYSAPGSVDISVTADQLPVWTALVSGKNTSVSVNEVPAERPGAVNVHLRTNFEESAEEETRLIKGIRYLSPELLIVQGLAEGDPGIEDVLAVLVVQRKALDRDKLLALCRAYNTVRYLGFAMEALNLESARKKLFEPDMIEKLAGEADLRAKVDFPVSKKGEPQLDAYPEISSKWNLNLHMGRAPFSKIITDLVRT